MRVWNLSLLYASYVLVWVSRDEINCLKFGNIDIMIIYEIHNCSMEKINRDSKFKFEKNSINNEFFMNKNWVTYSKHFVLKENSRFVGLPSTAISNNILSFNKNKQDEFIQYKSLTFYVSLYLIPSDWIRNFCHLTLSCALDLEPRGIQVNEINWQPFGPLYLKTMPEQTEKFFWGFKDTYSIVLCLFHWQNSCHWNSDICDSVFSYSCPICSAYDGWTVNNNNDIDKIFCWCTEKIPLSLQMEFEIC